MSEQEPQKRIGEVLSLLLAKRLELSLREVEAALAAWRQGEHDVTAAHAATLQHAARTSAFGARIAKAGLDGPTQLLRDAYDLKLIDDGEFLALTGQSVDEVEPAPPLDDEAAAPGAMPKKREVVSKLLEDGPVLIHLDARLASVDVPDQYRHDPKLVLRIGHDLQPQIPDLMVDDFGVRCTLTFRGRGHLCRLPWAAIYALFAEDGRGLVWREQVPPEVQAEYQRRSEGSGGGAARRAKSEGGGSGAASGGSGGSEGGRRVARAQSESEAGKAGDGSQPGGSAGDAPSPERPDKPKRGGHLRLV
jgi:stringent starvation protein B